MMVNTLSDTSTSGNGLCSLRKAINNANSPGTDTTGGDCVVGTGTDIINFSVSGTITLGSTLPAIQNNLAIDGTGQTVAVDGAGSYQVLVVNSVATLNLSSVTVAHASSSADGGGVANLGTLTVTNSTFSGNSDGNRGGAIGNGGLLAISNSTFSNNSAAQGGGAIGNFEGSAATITDSTFSGNSATSAGGAIHNVAVLTVTNSTFSGNSATSAGGAISNGAAEKAGTLIVTNSTFSGNTAPSAAGGGISVIGASATAFVGNSILSNESGGNCNISTGGTITNAGYDISDDASCGFGTSTGASGQTIGDSVNPLLDPNGLQNNGGPTETIALQSGSPAIAAIPTAQCPATDQRGDIRPALGQSACDIGAFELGGGVPTPTPAVMMPGAAFAPILQ